MQRFLQLLRLHRVAQPHAAKNLRREVRHASKKNVLALRKRVADSQRAVVRDAHHVAEAAYKAVGRALKTALRVESGGIPSTKGLL